MSNSLTILPGLIQKLDEANLFQRNYEPRFVEIATLHKCRFMSSAGLIVAMLDESILMGYCTVLQFDMYSVVFL